MEPIYHFISHSHWDREWYKTYETFRLDLADMILSLLRIFETVPDYEHFTLDGQTIVLEDFVEITPGHGAALREYIQAGKISIGPWYILPDEFLVSGESTVRNLLYGRKIGEKFGSVMQVGYIPDSFSHLAMMPAILRGFDMDTAIVYRGFGGEPGQEKSEYRWIAPDGSEVLMVHLPPNGYGDAYIGKDDPAVFVQKGNALKEILDPRATTPHRICMNGGDHHFPEPYLPEALRVMNRNCEGIFRHSSIPDFVDAVRNYLHEHDVPLAQVRGELHYGFRYAFAVQSGVYSSRMYIKQANRRCERLLTRYVEPLAFWATLAGREMLFPMAEQAWKLLLQNHPHDSICGCSVDAVHREMMTRFEKCEQIGQAVIEKSTTQIYPDAWDGPEHIIVFNPRTRPASDPVEVAIEFSRQKIVVGLNPDVIPETPLPPIPGFQILDAAGEPMAFQILRYEPKAHGLRYSDYSYPSKRLVERFSVLVDPRQVPGLGFAAYRVKPTDRMPTYESTLQVGPSHLENDFLQVTVESDGSLTLVDKRNRRTYTDLHVFEDGGDAGDEYNYSYPHEDEIITSAGQHSEVAVVETGPLRATLEIRQKLQLPVGLDETRKRRRAERVEVLITTRLSLHHNQPWVACETTVDNCAKDHRLRVLFATRFPTNKSLADSQFCITQREHLVVDPSQFTIEVPTQVHPMQRGVTVMDDTHGLTIASEGMPEYELKAEEPGTLALTLLRCVGLLSGGDLLTRPGGESGWVTDAPEAQCLGSHTFRYAIIPHTRADFETYGPVNEQIETFLLPCRATRRGGAPQFALSGFGLELTPAALVVSGLKPAENGDGFILRCYNPTARKIEGTLRSSYTIARATATQLNERDGAALVVEDGSVVGFVAQAQQIVSLRLRFSAPDKKGAN